MKAVLHSDGGSGPDVIYVPGIDASGEMLFDTAARLRDHFRLACIRYVEGGADTYAELAASLARLLDQLEIRPALLLAESFGGAVALQTALDHPEHVAGLLIVNSFAHFPRRLPLRCSQLVAPLARGGLFRLCRRHVGVRQLFGPRRNPEVERMFCAKTSALDRAYRTRLAMIAGVDLRPRLSAVTQPVTLFAADRDHVVPSRKAARIMQERLPDAQLVELERAGHVVLPLPEFPWVDWTRELAQRAGLTGRS